MSLLDYRHQKLFYDSVSIHDLAAEYATPFYLYSETALINQYKLFSQAAFEHQISNPLICFALKANPNPYLLESLFRAGAGADIVSGGELQRALQKGCDPQKIVFSGVGKTASEIAFALSCHERGIYSFNVESREELDMIDSIARQKNKRARVAFRLNPQVNAKTHKYISTGYKTHKFGLLKEDIIEILKTYERYSHIDLVGLSVHIGSQLTEFKATRKAVKELCWLAKQIPFELEFIDVGGGLGVDYHRKKKKSYLDLYMKNVASVIHEELDGKKKLRVLFEPGRFIAASAGVFITKVIRTKSSGRAFFAIVDGGMNDFVRTSLYGAYHHIIPCSQERRKIVPTEIVGPICETSDSFASKYKIQTLEPGELIAVLDVGAYGHSMSSTYNLRRRPKELTLTTHGEVILHEY